MYFNWNNINNINLINEKIKKSNNYINIKLKFIPEDDDEINEFLENIQKFGKINYGSIYKFKTLPKELSEERKYIITGENDNIITKTGENDKFICAKSEIILKKGKEYKWRIKIIKSQENNINVEVMPIESEIDISKIYKYGYFLYWSNSTFYSGPPHNYNGKKTNLPKVKEFITVFMNMKEGILKFIINNENVSDEYINIPLDKPLCPAVSLSNTNDSVEILECN